MPYCAVILHVFINITYVFILHGVHGVGTIVLQLSMQSSQKVYSTRALLPIPNRNTIEILSLEFSSLCIHKPTTSLNLWVEGKNKEMQHILSCN